MHPQFPNERPAESVYLSILAPGGALHKEYGLELRRAADVGGVRLEVRDGNWCVCILTESGHRFRFNPDTRSDRIRTLIPI
jgi:hypothetical protein